MVQAEPQGLLMLGEPSISEPQCRFFDRSHLRHIGLTLCLLFVFDRVSSILGWPQSCCLAKDGFEHLILLDARITGMDLHQVYVIMGLHEY